MFPLWLRCPCNILTVIWVPQDFQIALAPAHVLWVAVGNRWPTFSWYIFVLIRSRQDLSELCLTWSLRIASCFTPLAELPWSTCLPSPPRLRPLPHSCNTDTIAAIALPVHFPIPASTYVMLNQVKCQVGTSGQYAYRLRIFQGKLEVILPSFQNLRKNVYCSYKLKRFLRSQIIKINNIMAKLY